MQELPMRDGYLLIHTGKNHDIWCNREYHIRVQSKRYGKEGQPDHPAGLKGTISWGQCTCNKVWV